MRRARSLSVLLLLALFVNGCIHQKPEPPVMPEPGPTPTPTPPSALRREIVVKKLNGTSPANGWKLVDTVNGTMTPQATSSGDIKSTCDWAINPLLFENYDKFTVGAAGSINVVKVKMTFPDGESLVVEKGSGTIPPVWTYTELVGPDDDPVPHTLEAATSGACYSRVKVPSELLTLFGTTYDYWLVDDTTTYTTNEFALSCDASNRDCGS